MNSNLSQPNENVYILRQVRGIPKYDSLPMYRYQGSQGTIEKRSFVVAWKYIITLEKFGEAEPTDSLYTLKLNTYYYGHDLVPHSYDYPSLENTPGVTPIYTQDDGYLWIKNSDDPEYEIKRKIKIYNPSTDITKWVLLVSGLQQYYRHECYIRKLVE